MKITKISLTNFRSFKNTQTIDIAPVTLLFGPNSVGKSSVLMALFYLQEILAKGQCDPRYIESLGDKYIGGFQNLVNGRDLTKNISIKVEYDKSKYLGATYTEFRDILDSKEGASSISMCSSTAEANKVAIQFDISWSKSAKTAYVSKYTLWLNDVMIAEAVSDAGLKQPLIQQINYLHPLLAPVNHDEWLIDYFEQENAVHPDTLQKVFDLKGMQLPSGEWEDIPFDFSFDEQNTIVISEEVFVSEFHKLVNESRIPSGDYNNSSYMSAIGTSEHTMLHAPMSYKGHAGAIPILGRLLDTSLNLDDEKENRIVSEVLSDVLVAPLDNLLDLLNQSLCIGPLRSIPTPAYQPNPYPKQKDWQNGMAAWDILHMADLKLLKSVDRWMSDKDKLDLGYGLVVQLKKTFAEKKRVSALNNYVRVEQQLNNLIAEHTSSVLNDSTEKKRYELDYHSTDYTYAMYDLSKNMEVLPSDVGVGVSQLMPLLVAAVSCEKGIIAIEQPELHVHPRVQVAIGDMLTQLSGDISFFVETHSEHLILRILKRIRQTTDKELPDNCKPVHEQDISIVYLEPTEDGVVTKRIRIDEDGEFLDRWPQGFFVERREELM